MCQTSNSCDDEVILGFAQVFLAPFAILRFNHFSSMAVQEFQPVLELQYELQSGGLELARQAIVVKLTLPLNHIPVLVTLLVGIITLTFWVRRYMGNGAVDVEHVDVDVDHDSDSDEDEMNQPAQQSAQQHISPVRVFVAQSVPKYGGCYHLNNQCRGLNAAKDPPKAKIKPAKPCPLCCP